MMKNMELKITPLTKEHIGEFLAFFDSRAFEDNPAWGGCYCVFFHHAGDEADWLKCSKAENRNLAIELIHSGKMKGFLAFSEGETVGWCNAGEKTGYSFTKNRAEVVSSEDRDIISIVCFVTYHAVRGRGISRELLRAVIQHYTGSGKRFLEAYPLNDDSASIPYHGPKSLYLKNGFYPHRELDDYSILRCNLQ